MYVSIGNASFNRNTSRIHRIGIGGVHQGLPSHPLKLETKAWISKKTKPNNTKKKYDQLNWQRPLKSVLIILYG